MDLGPDRLTPSAARSRRVAVILFAFAISGCSLLGGDATRPGPRLAVFDCGSLAVADVASFGLTNADTEVRELFVPCYLVEHAGRRLFWDGGLPLAMAGAGQIEFGPGMTGEYRRSVIEQMAELGVTPGDVDFVAFSHMHFDHVGAANAFVDSTLLIQAVEDQAAFVDHEEFEIFDPSLYMALADARRVRLEGDHDVFGDGRVRILSAPGHTPGHQMLWLDLENSGPLILSGDLYHFRFSRRERRVPDFNYDREQTLASMARIEALLAETGATLWIEHDRALADTLRLAPAWYD